MTPNGGQNSADSKTAQQAKKKKQNREYESVTWSDAKSGMSGDALEAASGAYDLLQWVANSPETLDWLYSIGFDGIGIEVEVTGGIEMFGEVDFTPRGLSMLVLTPKKGDRGGPYVFAYSGVSIGLGVSIEASAGVGAVFLGAQFFGKDKNATKGSWAGGVVSIGFEGGGYAGAGGNMEFSFMGSQSQGLFGITNFLTGDYEEGWQGATLGGSIGTGAGGGASVHFSYAVTGPLSMLFDYLLGRPDIENMKPPEPIPNEGEHHYQKDVPGGGFFAWFADVTGPDINQGGN